MVWTFHHVLLDGWSVFQVLSDVFAAHAALDHGAAPPPPARRPFADYLGWLADQDPTVAERHWRRRLAGLESATALPYDRAPVQVHATRSSQWLALEVGEAESTRLRELAQGNGLTLNTVVQGVWALLLARLSGQGDVCFGTTVSARPPELAGVETITGIFINTLPVRVEVDDSAEVVGWLQRLQAAQAEARRFDYISLAQLQTWSDLPGGTKLFDSVLVFENYPIDNQAAAEHGLSLRDVDAVETTNYALSLVVVPGPCLSIGLGYDPDLFEAATIDRLAGQLTHVLEAVAAEPAAPLASIDILTSAERHQLLEAWNDTARPVVPQTLAELFEAQVARTPEAPAVVGEWGTLSYAEVDERANRLAHLLIAAGAGPERFVALALPRSVEMIVALLAVTKAGAAYLPIDPDYPAERIAFMLEDSHPVAVCTLGQIAPELARLEGVAMVVLDEAATAEALGAQPAHAPTDADRLAPLALDHPAYVIYTSGSTGRPKGVVVAHQTVVELADWAAGEFGPSGLARVVVSTSLNFDVSVFEIFCPLVVGGCIEVVSNVLALGEPRTEPWTVSLLSAVPSAFSQLLTHGEVAVRADHVVLAGVALSAQAVRDIRAALPGSRITNI